MDNPATAVLLMLLFCTVLPSALAFAVGRYGFPRITWSRRGSDGDLGPSLREEKL